MTSIFFRKLHPDAIIPEYKTSGSAGFDLHSVEQVEIPAGQVRIVDLGLSCEMKTEQQYCAGSTLLELQIRPRSGLAAKNNLTVLNSPGTVDFDFSGNLKVILANFGSLPYTVIKGERIAQGVINQVERAVIKETTSEHTITERGVSGFGSTGRF